MADRGAPDRLAVLLGGRVAGSIDRRAVGDYTLSYDEAWRHDPAAFPLSLSLPLAGRSHSGPALAYYLRALLPENEKRLNAIAHAHGVAPDDPFALLAHIGEDCPGAVQFARPERLSSLLGEGPGKVEWLSEHDLSNILRDLRSGDPERVELSAGQFSLPGMLDKAALARHPRTGKWGRPSGRAATTHIVKPALRGVKHHNENEHLCLELARAAGCAAAASFIVHAEDQAAIAVERFDRRRQGATVHRLHQEDIAQALGVNPRLKYVAEGAPGIDAVVSLLRDHSVNGLEDVYRFLRAIAFNWVVGGTDAHPRNYSIHIGAGGRVELAPLYDLASALLLPTKVKAADLPLAMTIGGRRTLGAVDRKAWADQAKSSRVDAARLQQEVVAVAERIVEAAPGVAARAVDAGIDTAFARRFTKKIAARASECATLMSIGP